MPHYFQSHCDHKRTCTFSDVEKGVIKLMIKDKSVVGSDCRALSACGMVGQLGRAGYTKTGAHRISFLKLSLTICVSLRKSQGICQLLTQL